METRVATRYEDRNISRPHCGTTSKTDSDALHAWGQLESRAAREQSYLLGLSHELSGEQRVAQSCGFSGDPEVEVTIAQICSFSTPDMDIWSAMEIYRQLTLGSAAGGEKSSWP